MHIILWILVFATVFWAVILLLDRIFNMEVHGLSVNPGFLIWRTRYGLNMLDRAASSKKNLWKVFGIAGGVIGSVLMLLVFLNLADKAVGIIGSIISPTAGGGAIPGIVPLVPGWTFPFELIIPILIALATVLLVHEPAHGIVARRIGFPVKSTGLLLFLVIPGAFVEPEEKKLKRAPAFNRLQVYGAGSFANLIFGFLCLGLMLALITPLPGLYVAGVYDNMPAENLQPGMRLMKVGHVGGDITNVKNYSDFEDFMKDTGPNENICVTTDNGSFIFTLISYPREGENLTLIRKGENKIVNIRERPQDNRGFLGVWIYPYYSIPRLHLIAAQFTSLLKFWESPRLKGGGVNHFSYGFHVPNFIIDLLSMMVFLNIGIGLANLLPLKPLDGGYIVECLFEKVSSRKAAKFVALCLGAITLSIIIINLTAWIG